MVSSVYFQFISIILAKMQGSTILPTTFVTNLPPTINQEKSQYLVTDI